jgi:hypothetical protein
VFEAQIIVALNQLDGNYSATEHNYCEMQLRHGQLNRVFKMVIINYRPRPKPIACAMKKRQAMVAVVEPPPSKKTSGGKRWKKALSHSGDKTTQQETMLVKPFKASKKFSMQKGGVDSSRLSISEKASSVKAPPQPPASTKTGGMKAPTASAVGDDSAYVLMLVIGLLASLVSKGEARPLKHRRKHVCKSPSPKASLIASRSTVVEGSIL